MGLVQEGLYRTIQGKDGGLFSYTYTTRDYVGISAERRTRILARTVQALQNKALVLPPPLAIGTSRNIFLVTLPPESTDEEGGRLVLKQSRFSRNGTEQHIVSSLDELYANRALAEVVSTIPVEELAEKAGYADVSVRVEEPLGILFDRRKRLRYTVYTAERGLYPGELIKHVDPPIEGGALYNREDWLVFVAIGNVLDLVRTKSEAVGLHFTDYGIHQVLFQSLGDRTKLELVLIDTERVKVA